MNKFSVLIVLNLLICKTAFSQQTGQAPPPNDPALTAPTEPSMEEPPKPKAIFGYKSEILEGFYEEFVYSAVDRRDPFSPYRAKMNFALVPITHPLQRFQLDQLKIIGIIWNTTSPKALVLDPAGTSYVILENDRIGNSNGYVAKIREGEVVVVEEHMDVAGNKAYLTKLMVFRKN